jgi:hypothetical protein
VIQVAPQMRILVAIESVDLRKYALSINMRSCAAATGQNGRLRCFGQPITALLFGSEHGEQLVRRPEVTPS